MNYLYALYLWIFKRLPRKFSVPLAALLAFYFLIAFPFMANGLTRPLSQKLGGYFRFSQFAWGMSGETYYLFDGLVGTVVEGVLTIMLALLGVLLSYWAAGFVYLALRKNPAERLAPPPPVPPQSRPLPRGETDLLKKYKRIGIILAGGGAKGAYQAGAMKAIYEFLEKYGAHERVKMVAGTSIGAWNAMFWLTDLVKGPDGRPGLLEQWWQQVDVQSVIRPYLYVPLRRNFFLSSQPWQETFEAFFVKNEPARQRLEALIAHADEKRRHGKHDGCDKPHFYLTRSNVARAQLEFTTNRGDLSEISENLPIGQRPRPAVPPDAWEKARAVY